MIIIGADFVPTESNYELFINGDVETLFGEELLGVLRSADYRIFNLETPFSDEKTPILKCGPALMAPTNTINAYIETKADLLTLANNHILDQGVEGLETTLKVLSCNNISYIGAGRTLSDAKKTFSFKLNNVTYGVFACAEHEFSIAGQNSPGANPFDSFYSLDNIEELKAKSDFVIVLYHGGKEHYRYPSPELQKTCRRIIEKGADLVICQHSHCIGCEEKYNGGTVIYGQGNFLFDGQNNEFWNESILVVINDDKSISYIPIVKCSNTIRIADKKQSDSILAAFKDRSKEIQEDKFVEQQYQRYASNFIEFYLSALNGYSSRSLFNRIINRISAQKFRSHYLGIRYNTSKYLAIQNFIECEAHRELLLEGLKQNIAQVKKQ